MDLFTIKLKKVLIKRLPQTVEYGSSRRIEGAMEANNVPTSHKHVTIIVDNVVNDAHYKVIAKKLVQFLRRDQYFKYSKYKILLWKQNSFSFVTPIRREVSAKYLNRYFDELNLDDTNSGNWDNYWELYKSYKQGGQAFLITTQEKVEALRHITVLRVNNLMVLYTALPGVNISQIISRIPCIANVENEENSDLESNDKEIAEAKLQ